MDNNITRQLEIKNVELYDTEEKLKRVEVFLSLDGKTSHTEQVGEANEAVILISVAKATIQGINALMPRALDTQIQYIKRVTNRLDLPASVNCLIRVRESGKDTLLNGQAPINTSLHAAAAAATLDALNSTIDRLLIRRDRLDKSGGYTVTEVLEAKSNLTNNSTNEQTPSPTKPLTTSENIITSQSDDTNTTDVLKTSRALTLLRQAEDNHKRGNYAQAATFCQEAIDLDSGKAEYYCQLAMSLAHIDTKEAEKAYLQAIELAPTNTNFHLELGLFFKEIGLVDKAGKYLQQALALDSDNVRAKRALNDTANLVNSFQVKAPTKELVPNNPISELKKRLTQPISRRMILISMLLMLSAYPLLFIGYYYYRVLTLDKTIPERRFNDPGMRAVKIVQDYPSATKGLTVKELVDTYIKEQQIVNYNWWMTMDKKTGKPTVIFSYPKDKKLIYAIWLVDLKKGICEPQTPLAKKFSPPQ